MESAPDYAPVAFLAVGTGTDQGELAHSWQAVLATGGQPVLVSPTGGDVELFRGLTPAGSMPVDVELPDADAADFAGLVLLDGDFGAAAPPAEPGAVAFVRAFFASGLPVAAIGRAPWLLIAANVVRGRRLTSSPSLRTPLRQAGACWVDEAVVVSDEGRSKLVTGQTRGDLPLFCQAFTRRFFGLA